MRPTRTSILMSNQPLFFPHFLSFHLFSTPIASLVHYIERQHHHFKSGEFFTATMGPFALLWLFYTYIGPSLPYGALSSGVVEGEHRSPNIFGEMLFPK